MRKRIAKTVLCLAVVAVVGLVFTTDNTFAASFSPKWKYTKPTNNGRKDNARPIVNKGWLDTQGVAFDVYTKNDGYAFNKGTDGNKDFQLVHFKFNKKGQIVKKGYVKYKTKNVGHANDAAIARIGGKKYMLFAVSGGSEKSSTASNGKSTKVGVIWMDEYNKKKAVVHTCAIKVKDGVSTSKSVSEMAISGVAYTGFRKFGDGKKRPVFVLKDGRTFYNSYLTIDGNRNATLTIYNSARVEKPKIKYKGKTYEASTQGVTYHNGYLYLSYSGETAKVINQNMLITRVGYGKLFKNGYGVETKMQIYRNRTVKAKMHNGKKFVTVKLAKNIPEAIFFRSLDGKGCLYLTINRANTQKKGKDIDCILRSSQKY